jgi:hypothetical protein
VYQLKLFFNYDIYKEYQLIVERMDLHATENKHNLEFFSKNFLRKCPKINNLYNQYNNFKILILTKVIGEIIILIFLYYLNA